MEIKTYTAICDQINQGDGQGSVRILIDPVPVAGSKQGEKTAKTVFQLIFSDTKEAAEYKYKGNYEITIKEITK